MDDIYILYSAKKQAWHTPGGMGSSDYKSAMKCTREEALDLVKLHRNGASFNLVPVNLNMLKEALL